MRDLLLDANFENWKIYWARRSDARFMAFAKRLFERDAYTCQYCAFQARSGLDIINIDGNYRHNKGSNMLTACAFCAQGFFLESIGVGSFGGGVVIHLPEISQIQLNALCHVLFPIVDGHDAASSQANSLLRDLKFRTLPIEKAFGEGMSEASKFGAMLLNGQLSFEERHKVLQEVRLLPQKSRFETQLMAWQTEASQDSAAEEDSVESMPQASVAA